MLPIVLASSINPLSGFGNMVPTTRVVRSVHSRCGLRGIRVREASNPGPRAKRKRRVVASTTELDTESAMSDDLEESQVRWLFVRVGVQGGCQDTTVVAPSNVDLHPGPEVAVLVFKVAPAHDVLELLFCQR